MKILLVNTLYKPYAIGGAEESTRLLAEGLLDLGHKPIVLTSYEYDDERVINNVPVLYVRMPNIYWWFHSKKYQKSYRALWHIIDAWSPFSGKIRKIIRKHQPDIIHTNNLLNMTVNIWKHGVATGTPVIHTLRDYYLMCWNSGMFKDGKSCRKQCNICKLHSLRKKNMTNSIDAVIGISQYILDKHLSEGYFKDVRKRKVIPNAFNIIDNSSHSLKMAENNEFILGYVGRLMPAKGIEWFLDVIDTLEQNIKVHIYGSAVDNQYEKYLKNKYKSPKIIFMGYCDKKDIYKNINLLIIPSLWEEPFGRTLIEANAYGVPVLATSVGGLKELIKDGVNGYLIPPGDVDRLKSMIKYFNNNRNCLNMSDGCISRSLRYSIRNTTLSYIDMYESIL
ncbi:MAG: glycosyltransferase family 4 protein [Candidatus Omnitrophica bacterium]|nr:glycosyltransferase family 4 protein [Candidatus Omnitrophota bacterium]